MKLRVARTQEYVYIIHCLQLTNGTFRHFSLHDCSCFIKAVSVDLQGRTLGWSPVTVHFSLTCTGSVSPGAPCFLSMTRLRKQFFTCLVPALYSFANQLPPGKACNVALPFTDNFSYSISKKAEPLFGEFKIPSFGKIS